MATYTFTVTRCQGGQHVHLVATEQQGAVIPIELDLDNLQSMRKAKQDYREYPDPIADILIELRKQLVASGAATFAQARAVILAATVVVNGNGA